MYKFNYSTGGFIYEENFVPNHEKLISVITTESDLHTEFLKLVGNTEIQIPRKTDYYGEKDYAYSGIVNKAKPFFKELEIIRQNIVGFEKLYKIISKESLQKLNSCLINYYKDNNDSISFHSDDEKELGPDNKKNILIASVSLGDSRVFSIRSEESSVLKFDINLKGGSLLIMYGDFQHKFEHAVLKSKEKKNERINLTYRVIL